MTQRRKPDLSVESGTWINPGLLTDDDRRDLMNVLVRAKGVEPKHRNELIDFVNTHLQWRGLRNETAKSVCDQLDDIAKKANDLLDRLESMSLATMETLALHAKETVWLKARPIEPEIAYRMGRVDEAIFLDAVWDHADALRMIAEYAKEAERPSKQDWPDVNQARNLTAAVTRCYMQLTSVVVPEGKTILRFGEEWRSGDSVPGEPPPKNRAGWFVEFMAVLGDKMGLKIGSEIVKSGIELALSRSEALDDVITEDLALVSTRAERHDAAHSIEATRRSANRADGAAQSAMEKHAAAQAAGDKEAADKYLRRANDWADRARTLRGLT